MRLLSHVGHDVDLDLSARDRHRPQHSEEHLEYTTEVAVTRRVSLRAHCYKRQRHVQCVLHVYECYMSYFLSNM